jgi:hypothetical protein
MILFVDVTKISDPGHNDVTELVSKKRGIGITVVGDHAHCQCDSFGGSSIYDLT